MVVRVHRVVLILLASCGVVPPAMPEAPGRGLLSSDEQPPPGAVTWARPEWRVGEQFVLVRGEQRKGTLAVAAVTEAHYELDPGSGTRIRVRRDRDLGNLGEWSLAGEPLHVLAPVDVRYHWPLWLGKRWSCEFVDRSPGAEPITMRADYLVEGLDTVTVPAGTFEALRVVRTVRRIGEASEFLTRAQVTWYAPAIGCEVRQLVGETFVELAAHEVPR